MKYYKQPIFVGSLIVVVVMLCGVIFYLAYTWEERQINWSDSQLEETSNSADGLTDEGRVMIVDESTSGTTNLSEVPANIKAVVSNFYLAYQKKDKSALGQLFTGDSSTGDADLHAALFTGADSSGNPKEPVLFVTSSASQWVDDYVAVAYVKQTDGSYLATIKEQRMTSKNEPIGEITTFIKIKAVDEKWLVDAYYLDGNIGKYNAFLAQ